MSSSPFAGLGLPSESYVSSSLFAGLGLLSESYIILTLPTLAVLLNTDLTSAVPTFMILGMLSFGLLGFVFPARRAILSLTTVASMFAFALTILTASKGHVVALVNVFAFVVGGEYCTSSHFTSESGSEASTAVGFVNQSVGAFLASTVMLISFHVGSGATAFYSTLFVGSCLLLAVFAMRVIRYTELGILDAVEPPAPTAVAAATASTKSDLRVIVQSSASWFLWDIIFYAVKLGQEVVISDLTQTDPATGESVRGAKR